NDKGTGAFDRRSAIRIRRSPGPQGISCDAARHLVASVAVMVPAMVVEIPVFPIMVPAVIMFNACVLTLPVAVIELFSIVTRYHPPPTRVRRSGPIPFMPPVMVTYRVPIPVYPSELGARIWRQNTDDTGRRRRPNSDSNRYLGGKQRCTS